LAPDCLCETLHERPDTGVGPRPWAGGARRAGRSLGARGDRAAGAASPSRRGRVGRRTSRASRRVRLAGSPRSRGRRSAVAAARRDGCRAACAPESPERPGLRARAVTDSRPGRAACREKILHIERENPPDRCLRRRSAGVLSDARSTVRPLPMEAATPLPLTHVYVLGDRLRVDGLTVDDECAVRLVSERIDAGDDPAKVVRDAVEIGARVLDREHTGANADFVKAEFERAARDLDEQFVERAREVVTHLDRKVDEAFGADNGHVTKALERHFGDGSSDAVQHKVRLAVGEVAARMREDLQRQFSSDSEKNPLAVFQRMAIGALDRAAKTQGEQLRAMDEKLVGLREEILKLQAEREKLEELDAERERGTAKGRTFEEAVYEALEHLAGARGDTCDAVGDAPGAAGKKGDVLVA